LIHFILIGLPQPLDNQFHTAIFKTNAKKFDF